MGRSPDPKVQERNLEMFAQYQQGQSVRGIAKTGDLEDRVIDLELRLAELQGAETGGGLLP